jgi:hypothetical protein
VKLILTTLFMALLFVLVLSATSCRGTVSSLQNTPDCCDSGAITDCCGSDDIDTDCCVGDTETT